MANMNNMTVEIPLTEYRVLIENAVKLGIIIDYLDNQKYIEKNEIRTIIGVAIKEDE